jgi:FkbM family methyltransferase
MLIPIQNIVEKYKLDIKNILHVGAHEAEENEEYIKIGAERIIWVEANPDLCDSLKEKLDNNRNLIFNCAVSDTDDEEISFMMTNHRQSSSILELGSHKSLFPGIYVNKQITLYTKTLKTLFKENNLSFGAIDFINLDIQGAELLALKGIGEDIKNVKAIFTEINTEYVYKNCALVHEIDEYLSKYNFKRVETVMWENHPWGDALYIKE